MLQEGYSLHASEKLGVLPDADALELVSEAVAFFELSASATSMGAGESLLTPQAANKAQSVTVVR